MHKSLPIFLGLCQVAVSGVYNWEATWVQAAPDGFKRPVIGINGKWPPPPIIANVGEQITVTYVNKLGNESSSLHWHGIHQTGTNQMDGAMPATQCPIPPDGRFTYSFKVDQPGTCFRPEIISRSAHQIAGSYWWHSHSGQYPDGIRAPLIVKDPNAPWKGKVAKEFTVRFSSSPHCTACLRQLSLRLATGITDRCQIS
jgi:iron transport multicopper oxidase